MPEKAIAVFRPKCVQSAARKVWLTFDDGPHFQHTKTILDTLGARGIRATFFVLGRNVERFGKELLLRARKEGHCIGNHCFSHQDLTKLSISEVRKEIMSAEKLIADLLGAEKLVRPPFGATNATVDAAIRELGYRKILWNVDTLDWSVEYQSERWVQHGVDQIRKRDNSVVLAHDIHKTTADYIGEFIERIARVGHVAFESCGTLEPTDAGPRNVLCGSRG
jgi:peptidoglycan/xylan/chitin deacetylase (PgdA/CDA1 family)